MLVRFFFFAPSTRKIVYAGQGEISPELFSYIKIDIKNMYRKKSIVRRPRKTLKRGGSKIKRSMPTRKLVNLIKKVSLKTSETKMAYTIVENNQLYHNVANIKQDMLYTTQGITATDTGTSSYSNRIGDEVIARGLSLKFWFANKLDRPNVMYRLVVFRYTSGDTVTSNDVFLSATTNFMLKDYNTAKVKVLYSKIFNLQVGLSANSGSSGWGSAGLVGKEAHRLVKVWIPLKNKKLKYEGDLSGVPKWTDIGFCIVPYDSYGTLTTDNIASYAYHSKFYFKDP